jgi:hypothetical protein
MMPGSAPRGTQGVYNVLYHVLYPPYQPDASRCGLAAAESRPVI